VAVVPSGCRPRTSPAEAFKEVVQKKFGDGIMSAIDLEMEIER
jgi:hypothetical protein